ncbi:MAG TPA: 50S ribosomal protein L30 [Actinomycetota bacterium]|jgi:large subunit ribosomal protein L30|nr:50S ribosomal protein L30 [Actinomycetota bacterium]
MAQIKVTQTKSPVSLPKDQGRTLKALGLHRMRDTVEHTDSPSVLGMVHKVRHLVTVEKLEGK